MTPRDYKLFEKELNERGFVKDIRSEYERDSEDYCYYKGYEKKENGRSRYFIYFLVYDLVALKKRLPDRDIPARYGVVPLIRVLDDKMKELTLLHMEEISITDIERKAKAFYEFCQKELE